MTQLAENSHRFFKKKIKPDLAGKDKKSCVSCAGRSDTHVPVCVPQQPGALSQPPEVAMNVLGVAPSGTAIPGQGLARCHQGLLAEIQELSAHR